MMIENKFFAQEFEGQRRGKQSIGRIVSMDYIEAASHEDIRGDICVDPDPSSPLNDVSTWIKIMEYMAYGKPIVSFDLKETRFSAQTAALFVPPNDEVAFAKAIMTLMDDPGLRQTMGQFGRRRVENDLQWSVVGQSLGTAYGCLAKL